MPSKSRKQARLMAAAAHDQEFARRVGVPVKVAMKFFAEDQKRKKLRARSRRT